MTKLRILIYTDGENFIGQCIERDLCVEGATFDDIKRRMSRQVEYYVSKGTFDSLPKAPDDFEGEWATSVGDPRCEEIAMDTQAEFKVVERA